MVLADMDNEIPVIDSVWRNKRGSEYKVLQITNQHSELPKKYPVTIVYMGDNGRIWSRPLEHWQRSMKLLQTDRVCTMSSNRDSINE